jgi:hypothetical protein
MVLVLITAQGANTVLERIDCEPGRALKTHRTTWPKANPDDIEHFRRSPSTVNRFGFANPGQARALGFGPLSIWPTDPRPSRVIRATKEGLRPASND